ncbi:hypothetical protein DAEQUDRAFT_814142 [Daedalea quercina L-15889]|uniref:Zn(2)-C6 fungal-type domain-containing protein n=1 Tax=Daedalea quercina L-15889 TaxID=1314783 RepID=A0A165MFX7_9APHY|nr:hypothetical protein DAEQUDRAFT_814142 [Daedalea quercina L-15889]
MAHDHVPSESPGEGLSRYQCPDCTSTFSRRQNLQRHRRTHVGLTPHECPSCREQFTRTDLLQRHIHQHHRGLVLAPPPPRACKACASSKMRCDRESPCSRCRTKGLRCEPQSSSSARASSNGSLSPPPETRPQLLHDAHTPMSTHPMNAMQGPADQAMSVDLPDFSLFAANPPPLADFPVNLSDFLGYDPLLGFNTAFMEGPANPWPAAPMVAPVQSIEPAAHRSPMSDLGSSGGSIPDSMSPSGGICPTLEMLSSTYWPSSDSEHHSASSPSSVRSSPIPRNIPLPSVSTCRNDPASFFTPAMRARYPALYAAHFERHWPLLGTHTVDLSTLYPALGVAVCCVGAMYDGVPAHRRLATAVMLVQRTSLITKLSTHRLDDGEALAMLQALFLYQVLGAFQHEKNYRDLTNVFHGSLVQLIRRYCILEPSVSAPPGQATARVRLAHGVFFLDALQPILAGTPALLNIDELRIGAPPPPALFRLLMDVRAGPAAIPDAQAALILILALLGRVLELLRLRQSADALCADGGATSDALDAALVQRARGLGAALRRWKDAWDALDPAHGAGSPVPACENAMPIYMIVLTLIAHAGGSAPWTPPGQGNPEERAGGPFAQFCRSFRTFLNETEWSGLTWLFPPFPVN